MRDRKNPPIVEKLVKETHGEFFVTFKVLNAYEIKEDLKELGFHWNPEDKTWDYNAGLFKSEDDPKIKKIEKDLEHLECEFE